MVVQTDEGLVNLKRERRVDTAICYGRLPTEGGAELLLREAFDIYGAAVRFAYYLLGGDRERRAKVERFCSWLQNGLPASLASADLQASQRAVL